VEKRIIPYRFDRTEELNAALGTVGTRRRLIRKISVWDTEEFCSEVMGEDLFKLATEKLTLASWVYKNVETGKPVYAFFHLHVSGIFRSLSALMIGTFS
jgi:hypothetical protein